MVHVFVKEYWKLLAGIVVLLAVLGYLTYSFVAPGGRFADVQNDLKTIQPGEDQAYTDLDGTVIDLRSYDGKPLIVNAWATWVPFSQTELPLLAKTADAYGDTITIIAMNRMENTGIIRSFLDTFGIPQSGRLVFGLDPQDTFYKAIGGYAMPETLFYSRDGVLVEQYRGVLTEEYLRSRIQMLLE